MNWRTSVQWYIWVVVLPWTVFFFAWIAASMFFSVRPRPISAVGFVETFVMTLLFGPLWEELAWRAFALRRLESRYSRLVSALIVGMYWAVWHIPLWLLNIPRNSKWALPILLAASSNLLAWSLIWAYFYHRSSESLPVVILLHVSYSAAWSQVFRAIPGPEFIFISSILVICIAPLFAKRLISYQEERSIGRT